MLEWNALFDEVRKHTDPEGLKYIDLGQSQLAPVDQALKSGDIMGAVKIARGCIPYLQSVLPYVNEENLKQHLIETADRVEKFLGSVEKQGPTMWAINTFFSAESKNLGNILGALVKAVVNVVHNVTNLVGGVVHDVGGLVGGLAHKIG